MNYRQFLLWLGCCCCYAFAKAQSPQAPNQSTIKLVADQFYGVDDFDHLYYEINNVFYKKSLGSKSTVKPQEFFDVQLGALTSVDIINPLKILLFYKDTQTAVFVDNRLNESLRIDLSSLTPYRYFDYIALAGERRLWLFNTDADRVELYDYINNNIEVSTPVIKRAVHKMLTDYNFCHLVTPSGIISYNNYGSKVGGMQMNQIQLADYDFEKLVLLKNNGLHSYKFKRDYSFEETTHSWGDDLKDVPQSFYLKNGKLYLYRHKTLTIYTTNQKKN